MEAFGAIFERAAARKGGAEALQRLLPVPRSAAELKQITDDRYLAEMSKCIFRSGFVWKIVESKWPGFEQAFHHFDTTRCAMLSDEELLALGRDERIIRHAKKIASVRDNAWFVRDVTQSHGGFGAYLAEWPADDIVGLWAELQRRGSRLGGNTGQYFLRFCGKDTFILSPDVVRALGDMGIIEGKPGSKKAKLAAQQAFCAWRKESGRPLCQISRVLSCSID